MERANALTKQQAIEVIETALVELRGFVTVQAALRTALTLLRETPPPSTRNDRRQMSREQIAERCREVAGGNGCVNGHIDGICAHADIARSEWCEYCLLGEAALHLEREQGTVPATAWSGETPPPSTGRTLKEQERARAAFNSALARWLIVLAGANTTRLEEAMNELLPLRDRVYALLDDPSVERAADQQGKELMRAPTSHSYRAGEADPRDDHRGDS